MANYAGNMIQGAGTGAAAGAAFRTLAELRSVVVLVLLLAFSAHGQKLKTKKNVRRF